MTLPIKSFPKGNKNKIKGEAKMNTEKYVVDTKNFKGYSQTITRNGKCIFTGKTEQEYIAEGYSVLTWEEYKVIFEKHLDEMCNDWKEITEDQYEDALNVLPPLRWGNGGFYMMEMYTDNVTSFYQQIGNKYYTSLQRLSYKREDILKNLNEFIGNKNKLLKVNKKEI